MPARDTNQGRTFELRGGQPCLDFVNTVAWRLTEHPVDYLASLDDLVAWGVQAGLLPPGEDGRPGEHGQPASMAMPEPLARARALRETIHRLVTAAAAEATPDDSDLAALNRAVSGTLARQRLVHAGSRFEWSWEPGAGVDQVLWEVTRSAAELLVSPDLDRVKVCAGPGCGWLFLDGSRNRSRRWCDSRDCGNRERVRQHLARKRAARSDSR